MIFITGYKGFIGSYLTEQLTDWKGYTGDILDVDDLIKQMRGCDTVIHLAGKFGKVNNDDEIYRVNVQGTSYVVKAMNECGIKKIIYLSSVGADHRFYNAYDDSKFLAEKALIDKSINPVILRPSNIYGTGQKDKLIASLIKGFKKGRLTLHGDGKQTRDLVHVRDVVNAILLSLKTKHKKPIDIGFGKSYSVLEVVDILSKTLGSKPKIEFEPFPFKYKDFLRSEVDITNAAKVLGYRPKYNLTKGLKEMLT